MRLKFLSLIAIIFIANLSAFSLDRDSIAKKKSDFILSIANSISYPESKNLDSYRIGIYGKNKMLKTLFQQIESETKDRLIQGKKVEVFQFKKTKSITPVDILFITGDSKIRISELNNKLTERPYLIVTENFPFGSSMINFNIDKRSEVYFEIQESVIQSKGATIAEAILNNPNRVLSRAEWEQRLENATKIIRTQSKSIQEKEEKIEEIEVEIDDKKNTIFYQRIILLIALISIIIIGFLSYRLYQIIQQRKIVYKELRNSINYAAHIQNAILPSLKSFQNHFPNSFIIYRPKDIVSGDFYWLQEANDKVFFSAADCTGHGIPGAMLSSICSNSLTKAVKELKCDKPGEVLDVAVEIIEERFAKSENQIKDGMDLALCSYNTKTRVLEYAGAYNALYLIKNGELSTIKANRQPIGQYERRIPFKTHEVQIEKGDRIYISSDGYVDQFGGELDKKFSTKRFKELLIELKNTPIKDQQNILDNHFLQWKGNREQIDDICIIGIEF